MWKYCIKNEYDTMSLHDCVAQSTRIDDNNLVFGFPDGIWVLPDNEHNPCGKTIRTDSAEIKFIDFEPEYIYAFKEYRIFRRLIFTKRLEIDLNILIKNINNGKWRLEFLHEYRNAWGLLLICWIWYGNGKSMECQLSIDFSDTEYYWNKLREDREW